MFASRAILPGAIYIVVSNRCFFTLMFLLWALQEARVSIVDHFALIAHHLEFYRHADLAVLIVLWRPRPQLRVGKRSYPWKSRRRLGHLPFQIHTRQDEVVRLEE